jgi:hypothetical protein
MMSEAKLVTIEAKIGRLGAWAPGSYTCKCLGCGDEFVGDKRALNCLGCAIEGAVARTKIEAAETASNVLANLAARASELASDKIAAYFDDIEPTDYEQVGFMVYDAIVDAYEERS